MNEINKQLKAGHDNARSLSASTKTARYGNTALTHDEAIEYGAYMLKLGINYAVISIQGEDPDKGDGTQ